MFKRKFGERENLDVASKEITIEESINYGIAQEELKDAIVDPIMKIGIEESNHVEESYIEIVQNMNVYCKDLIGYEDEKLSNFDIASEI